MEKSLIFKQKTIKSHKKLNNNIQFHLKTQPQFDSKFLVDFTIKSKIFAYFYPNSNIQILSEGEHWLSKKISSVKNYQLQKSLVLEGWVNGWMGGLDGWMEGSKS